MTTGMLGPKSSIGLVMGIYKSAGIGALIGVSLGALSFFVTGFNFIDIAVCTLSCIPLGALTGANYIGKNFRGTGLGPRLGLVFGFITGLGIGAWIGDISGGLLGCIIGFETGGSAGVFIGTYIGYIVSNPRNQTPV